MLNVGDIVRVHLTNCTPKEKENKDTTGLVDADSGQKGSQGLPYFKIVKIKDGTFWGEAKNTYGTLDWLEDMKEGDVFTFRKEHITEIPIMWQSKSQQRKMEQCRRKKGYAITGMR
mmetsp:Transcript_7466/g.13924  ORF Transcript_7466/g.13924 Transcript_7466/m.13924 type:complete len:116 (-) Transcript_7466:146-493(-)